MDHGGFGGGMDPKAVQRVKSLASAQKLSQVHEPFRIQPGGSSLSVFEAPKTHILSSKGTHWEQQVATPSSKLSTKYEKLFPALQATDLTRANKALVKGGSDSLSTMPGSNTWRGKPYSDRGMLTASLLRVNEASTAFGVESMGTETHDVGRGLMAEVLREKWSAKSSSTSLNMGRVLAGLAEKYPQLDTVEKMRAQGSDKLLAQVADSRMGAAVSAALRGRQKGVSDINEYVQRKFAKHGLGPVPGGWAEI